MLEKIGIATVYRTTKTKSSRNIILVGINLLIALSGDKSSGFVPETQVTVIGIRRKYARITVTSR